MTGRGSMLTALGALTLASFVSAAGAEAQEDFRAADADRPILVEDADPTEFREFEFEFGARGALREGGSELLGIVELKGGLFRNAEVGVGVEAGLSGEGAETPGLDGGTAGGIETFGAHLLYGLRRETASAPAVSFRVDLNTPGVGDLGLEDWSAGFKGIATRSFGRLRLHGNGGYVVASDPDGGDLLQLGLGFDYPIGLFSRALLGDVFTEIPVNGGRARVWAELGSRWQLSNWSVLDVGLATRLDEWEAGNANVELIIGLSRVFGIAAFTSVPPYPDPTLN